MRIWNFWWRTFLFASQYNPPRFIEVVMLTLAMALIGIWGFKEDWPYLVLALSYTIGAAVSILVREAITPSPQPRVAQAIAVLMLIISFYGFADLYRYF